MQKKSFSWGAIALLLVFFFPVGIYMLVSKVTTERFNYVKNGQSLKTMAIVLFCLSGMYLIMGITEETSVLSVFFLLGVLGIFCFIKGDKYIKKGTRYNRYVSIINSNNDTLIDNIAAAYPTNYEQAIVDIQEMLNDGYFMNGYIDSNRRQLIIPINAASVNVNINQTNVTQQAQPTSIKCKNCGATNKIIPGAVNECEYCGSPL